MLMLLIYSLVCGVVSQMSLFATERNIGITLVTTKDSCNTVNACDTQDSSKCFTGIALTKINVVQNTFVGSIVKVEEGLTYSVTVTCVDQEYQGTISMRTWNTDTASPTSTFFVSPDGTSSSCSTPSTPCSVSSVIPSQLGPGVEVVFLSGTYRPLPDIYGKSGTWDEPIIFRGGEDGAAIFDGSVDITGDLVHLSGGKYDYTWGSAEEKTTDMVVLVEKATGKAERLLYYKDLGHFGTLHYGNLGFYKGDSTLSIDIGTDKQLSEYSVLISDVAVFLYMSGASHYVFKDLEFRFIQGSDFPKAVYFDTTCEYVHIKNCVFDHAKIGMKRETKYFLIEDNIFKESKFHLNWNAVKNTGIGYEAGAIANFGVYDATGRGTTIRNNEFTDFFDALGCTAGRSSPFLTSEVDIYQNRITRACDDAIEADGYASNMRIYDNVIKDVLVGISFAPSEAGPVYAFNNVIYGLGKGNSQFTGMAFKINHNMGPRTGPIYVYHNVAITNNEGSTCNLLQLHNGVDLLQMRNNILIGDEYAVEVVSDTDVVFDFDYDALYAVTEGEFAWYYSSAPTHLTTLEAFQSYTGLEMNGIELTPAQVANLFIDEVEFQLSPGSVLIGKAVLIPGINDHLTSLDIGLLSTLEVPTDDNDNDNDNDDSSAFDNDNDNDDDVDKEAEKKKQRVKVAVAIVVPVSIVGAGVLLAAVLVGIVVLSLVALKKKSSENNGDSELDKM